MITRARVFAGNDASPELAALVNALRQDHPDVTYGMDEDAKGWYTCRINLGSDTLVIERFLRDEDGIVGQLQAWAAWVESQVRPDLDGLTALLATCRQVFVISGSAHAKGLVAVDAARWLTASVEGVYQVEATGFFDRSGALLLVDKH